MTGIVSKLVRVGLLAGVLAGSYLPAEAAFAAPPASAGREQPGPNRVRVAMKVVLATPGGQMDPRLQGIAKELRANFEQMQGFQLQSTHSEILGPNQDLGFQFSGGRRAKVTLVSKEDTRARVRIELFNPAGERSVDTTVWINAGKSFLLSVKGPEGRLILPVSVDL